MKNQLYDLCVHGDLKYSVFIQKKIRSKEMLNLFAEIGRYLFFFFVKVYIFLRRCRGRYQGESKLFFKIYPEYRHILLLRCKINPTRRKPSLYRVKRKYGKIKQEI